MNKKIISMVVTIALVIVAPVSTASAADYSDMANHWSKSQVSRWSDYRVINGSNGLFHPNDYITRGEMAVITDKVMGYQVKAKNNFADLNQSFYTDSILKANHAGVINGSDGLVRPQDYITREEVAVLVCKAFHLAESAESKVTFADSVQISTWAGEYVNALANQGYITGRGGTTNHFDPQGNIIRAEALTIVDNIVKGFYSQPGTYSASTEGNVVINTPDVVLKNMKINGNLIVAEGVGNGDFTLDGVKVSGSVILKGGGVNSIHFKGKTEIPKVELAKIDGDIRLSVEESATVNTLNILEHTKNVILAGKIENVRSDASHHISLIGATISNLSLYGQNTLLDVNPHSKVEAIQIPETVSAPKLAIQGTEGEVGELNLKAPNSHVSIEGKVSKINVYKTAEKAMIDAQKGCQISNVEVNADGTEISGAGRVINVHVNVDHYKIDTTGTKITTNLNNQSRSSGGGGRLNPVKVKTVTLGTQAGKLQSGTSGSATFAVTTENIADGLDVIASETDVNGNAKTTTGLSITASKTANNQATVTAAIDNAVPAGTYYFKVTVDGKTSSLAAITVDAPLIKTVSLDFQAGKLQSGTSGSATFAVTTENIAEGEDVIVTETDANGNAKTTTGLSITGSKTANNQAMVTAAIDNAVPAGTYYFNVTVDGQTSSLAAITVDTPLIKTVSLGFPSWQAAKRYFWQRHLCRYCPKYCR